MATPFRKSRRVISRFTPSSLSLFKSFVPIPMSRSASADYSLLSNFTHFK